MEWRAEKVIEGRVAPLFLLEVVPASPCQVRINGLVDSECTYDQGDFHGVSQSLSDALLAVMDVAKGRDAAGLDEAVWGMNGLWIWEIRSSTIS